MIEVICGGMFSGKTEELIRRVNRAKYAKQKVQSFKHSLDNRYSDNIHSHSDKKEECISTDHLSIDMVDIDTKVVAIDEAQFFDFHIISFVKCLSRTGIKVIIAGLDMDYLGCSFGEMPYLLAIADTVTKLKAVCMKCGNDASMTQKLIVNLEITQVGSKELYEARCRNCHYK